MKFRFFCILCVSFLLWSCQKKTSDQPLWIDSPFIDDESTESDQKEPLLRPVRAAMLLPFSGKNATMGESFQKAGMMALYEHPKSPLELNFFDTQGTEKGTISAWKEAVRQNPDLIIGPIFSNELKTLKAESPDIPILSFTTDTSLMEADVYTMGVLIPDQINRVVQYMCEAGQMELAVLTPDNKTGELAMNTLNSSIGKCPGMQISKVSIYNPKTINFDPAIRRIVPKQIDPDKKNLTEEEKLILETPIQDRLEFDALLIFDDGIRLRQIISLLSFYDVTPSIAPVYGLAPWQTIHDKNLVGAYFPGVTGTRAQKFIDRYQKLYGAKPPRLASLSYDAVSLVSILAEHHALTQSNLTLDKGYNGVDGRFHLNANGTNERLLEMFQVTPQLTSISVQSAPDIFWDKETEFTPLLPELDTESVKIQNLPSQSTITAN